MIVFSFSFPAFSCGAEAVVLAFGPTIFQNVCLPACKWCSGSIHDVLETPQERETREWLHGLTSSDPQDRKMTLENCQINIFENEGEASSSKSSLLARLLEGEDPSFKGELQRLNQNLKGKGIPLYDLAFGQTVHALVFHDENHIFPIGGWIREPSHHAFDFLFKGGKLSFDEEVEKLSLEKIVSRMNQILSKSEEPEEGLFLSPSGRRFYKFGPTYIFPLSIGEMDTSLHIPLDTAHYKIGFEGVKQMLSKEGIDDQDFFSQTGRDLLEATQEETKEGETKEDNTPNAMNNEKPGHLESSRNTFKKRSIARLKNCFGCIHDFLEKDPDKLKAENLKRERLNSVIKNPNLQESMIDFKMKNCDVHLFDHTPDFLDPGLLTPAQKELQMIWEHKKDLLDIELTSFIHILVFENDTPTLLPIHGVIKKPNLQNFDHLFKGQGYSTRKPLDKFLGVLNGNLENSTDPENSPYEGLYISPTQRLFYKFGSTYFLPLTTDELPVQPPRQLSVSP